LRAATRAARREGDRASHVPVLMLDGALLREHLARVRFRLRLRLRLRVRVRVRVRLRVRTLRSHSG